MIPIPSQFDQKDPREQIVITFDATAMLASGETLTSIASTSITTTIGADATPALVLSGEIINGSPLTLLNGKTIAAGCAVQAVASAGTFASTYWIAITCATSNPNKTLTLKASLPMASQ
ncbi:MAG TPA: hypothetical protein VF783_14265 [Terriglobales bacterium]